MSEHAHAEGHAHPGPKQYAIIAAVLCAITYLEYEIFNFREMVGGALVPILVILSTIKFALVVMFYMHLKFDHPVFTRMLLTGMFVAGGVMLLLMLLFFLSHPIGL